MMVPFLSLVSFTFFFFFFFDLVLYFIGIRHNTDNPLYTDTRYNDKSRYNDIFTVRKPSLKR